MSATLSHRIRTPLNAVVGMAEVLAGTALTPEQAEYVKILRRNALELLAVIDEAPDVSEADPAEPDQPLRLSILLADDSEDNRALILAYLRGTESQIDFAVDGRNALQLFKGKSYDLVLMDIEMPLMDGYEATAAIRHWEQSTGAALTPILALTAHSPAEVADRMEGAGFTDLLTKPIRKSTLLRALRRHAAMDDLTAGYLAKRREDVPVYRRLLGAGDFESIRLLAHKMKGTGAGYGYPALSELGSLIEKAAGRRDAGEIEIKVNELAKYVASIGLEYINKP